ncbi:MAG TPA: hypothetical protein VFW09_12300 [Solirubrobacteraceae bacterium]|nr:hypothetical protein [Solirubrobacteraceae bacterium]
MAPDPERSRRRQRALAPLLGGDARIAAVEALLQRRALEWAEAVAASVGAVVEAGSGDAVPAGVGDSGSCGAVSAGAGDGPTLLVWPELPVWLPETGAAALADLAAGCAASIGAVFDGRLYLLAVGEPIPGLVDGPPAIGQVLRVVEERGLEVGLLRAERGLREPDDVRALLADPLTDAELLTLLG